MKPVFEPKKAAKPIKKHVGLAIDEEKYKLIVKAASMSNVSIDSFCLQAIDFAMQHLPIWK